MEVFSSNCTRFFEQVNDCRNEFKRIKWAYQISTVKNNFDKTIGKIDNNEFSFQDLGTNFKKLSEEELNLSKQTKQKKLH